VAKPIRIEDELLRLLKDHHPFGGFFARDVKEVRRRLRTQGICVDDVEEALRSLKLRHLINIKRQSDGRTRLWLRPAAFSKREQALAA